MERDACCALFYADQRFKVAVREYQRQAGDAVNQAVREASEKYEEIQGIQTRNEGRMEETERRVAQGMGPKQEKLYVVREAINTGYAVSRNGLSQNGYAPCRTLFHLPPSRPFQLCGS